MIKPDKNPIHCQLLDWYLDRKFKQRISSVNYFYHSQPVNSLLEGIEKHAVLLIGNHSTWWDGFLGWQLNRKLLKKKFFIMMLEENLKKMWFFRKIGAFSINPGNRTMIESLKYAAELLKVPQNMVQFYPQGQLYSLYERTFQFNKGLGVILKNNMHVDIVFYAMFIDYGSNEKPYLNIFLDKVDTASGYTVEELQHWYRKHYEQSLAKHLELFKP